MTDNAETADKEIADLKLSDTPEISQSQNASQRSVLDDVTGEYVSKTECERFSTFELALEAY